MGREVRGWDGVEDGERRGRIDDLGKGGGRRGEPRHETRGGEGGQVKRRWSSRSEKMGDTVIRMCGIRLDWIERNGVLVQERNEALERGDSCEERQKWRRGTRGPAALRKEGALETRRRGEDIDQRRSGAEQPRPKRRAGSPRPGPL